MCADTSKSNIRHELDPEKVKASVAKKIAEYEKHRIEWKARAEANVKQYAEDMAAGTAGKNWTRKPDGPAYVDPMIDEWIARETDCYALVRVIELPQEGNRFILVYGDEDDATVKRGTGPFESFERAAQWFYNTGR